MENPITITIGGAEGTPERLDGFQYFWCKYVRGFDARHHCARCLLGHWARGFYPRMRLPAQRVLDERSFDYVYLCGVDRRGGNQGLHIAMQHAPGERIEGMTYNGILVVVENARQLSIPPLPDDWRGLGWEYTRCMNFRFALSAYGENGALCSSPTPEVPQAIQLRLF